IAGGTIAKPERGRATQHRVPKRFVDLPRRDAHAEHPDVEAPHRQIPDGDDEANETGQDQNALETRCSCAVALRPRIDRAVWTDGNVSHVIGGGEPSGSKASTACYSRIAARGIRLRAQRVLRRD